MARFYRMARLLEIISLVRSDENLKPKDLASHFEISTKRIHDDITELNMAGVPIIFEGNGYKILPGFFLPPMNFTLDEIFLALLSFKEAARGNPAEDYQKNLEKLTHKFTSSLSSINKNMYRGASEKIASMGTPSPGNIPTRIVSKICQGIAEHTQVEILYNTPGKDNPKQRLLDPYSLIHRKNGWYLIGFCHSREEIRTFKLVRIKQAWSTLNHFDTPKDFDVNQYLGNSWWVRKGDSVDVSIRFDEKVSPYILEKSFPHAKITQNKDGSIIFETRVDGLDEITWWTLQYGEHAQVLEPPEMRKKIIEVLKKTLSVYNAKKK